MVLLLLTLFLFGRLGSYGTYVQVGWISSFLGLSFDALLLLLLPSWLSSTSMSDGDGVDEDSKNDDDLLLPIAEDKDG